jgi:hypothetical protein
MDFRTLATLAAALSAPFGLAFLLAPTATAALYGAMPGDAFSALLGRHFGVAFLMYAAAAWGLRDLRDPAAQRRAAALIAPATAAGLAVTLLGLADGTLNALAWSSAGLYALFAAGWARFAFGAPRRGAA